MTVQVESAGASPSELRILEEHNAELRAENGRLHEKLNCLYRCLRNSEEVISRCENELVATDFESIANENTLLKEMLCIADFDFDFNSMNQSGLPASTHVSPSHHSSSFQLTSPLHSTLLANLRTPMNTSPIGLQLHVEESDFMFGDAGPDIADVGPPMSPPSSESISIKYPQSDASNEQDEADREDSQKSSADVQQDLNSS